MTTSILIRSNPLFSDIDGTALENGYLYIGTANANPEIVANQLQVYYDADLTIPAAQPVRTINGYPARSGSPAKIYVSSAADYSLTVRNAQRTLVVANRTSSDFVISNDSISTVMIQDLAVTTAKLAALAVTTGKIANDAVDKTKIAADVAGLGLSQAVGGELDVNVDASTIEISVDTLRVKAAGITNNEMAANSIALSNMQNDSVGTSEIVNEAITPAKMIKPTAGNTYEIARFVAAASGLATLSTSEPDSGVRFSGGCEVVDKQRIGFLVIIGGVIRIKYEHSAAVNDAETKILKNGTIMYTHTTTVAQSPYSVSEDVTVSIGDIIQIIHWATGIGSSTIADCRVTSNVNTAAIG